MEYFPAYTINWTAGNWAEGKREITATTTLSFSYADEFNFVYDPANPFTIITDVLAEIKAGDGAPFWITGSFEDSLSLNVLQYE